MVVAGAMLGFGALTIAYFGIVLAVGITSPVGIGLPALIPLVLYVVVAVVLAARKPTAAVGAGLLFGLGAWLLAGGGPCVAFQVQTGALT